MVPNFLFFSFQIFDHFSVFRKAWFVLSLSIVLDGQLSDHLITGNRDNIFGISFAEKNSSDDTIEVVEWNFSNSDNSKIGASKEEVLKQVLSSLKLINKDLKTNYQLSKIYYVACEDGSKLMYRTFLRWLIKYYHIFNFVLYLILH